MNSRLTAIDLPVRPVTSLAHQVVLGIAREARIMGRLLSSAPDAATAAIFLKCALLARRSIHLTHAKGTR